MIVEDFTYDSLRHVALNMRDRDFEELSAVSWSNSRAGLADELARTYCSFREQAPLLMSVKVVRVGGEPAAVFGWIRIRPSTAALVLFATPAISRVRKGFLRLAEATRREMLANTGILRVECHTLEGYKEIQGWLELLGMKREATLPCFGKRGETFAMYSLVNQ